jgi:hypothetical protein
MASNSNTDNKQTAAPERPVTPDLTHTQDAAADTAKPLFTKQDVSNYIGIGVSAALKKLQADYDSRLAALNTRLKKVEAENDHLRDQLESTKMDMQLAQTAAEVRTKRLEHLQSEAQNAQVRYLEIIKKHESEINDLEQYSRRSHIRIRGLRVQTGETYKGAVARFCANRLHVQILETDLDDAHPLPSKTTPRATTAQSNGPPTQPPLPTIIVRFFRRDQRDAVLRARSALKNQGIVIMEDLTKRNQELLKKLKDSELFTNSWSWMGKIYAVPHGQKTAKRFHIHDDIPSN